MRLIEGLFPSPGAGLIVDASAAFGKLALFLGLMAPWLVLAERRVRGLTRLGVLVTGAVRRLRAR